MLEQSTLYTLGFVIIVIIALQYISFILMRKYVKNEIGKIARALLKNKSNVFNNNQELNNQRFNNQEQDKNDDDKEESVDVDTPTNIENEDIDSYVNPVPSVDNDS